MVVAEQPTEAFMNHDIAVANCSVALNPFVTEALMRTLGMVMSNEVGDGAVA